MEVVERWHTSRVEREVVGTQVDWGCSLATARAYALAREQQDPEFAGSTFLLKSLLALWPCNAWLLLSKRLNVGKIAQAARSISDFGEGPTVDLFAERAQAIADSLGHEIWGTDHLLLTILESECNASLFLNRVGLNGRKLLQDLESMNREAQDLEWEADSQFYRGRWKLEDPVAGGGLARKQVLTSPAGAYKQAGEQLVKLLNLLARGANFLEEVVESELFQEILKQDPKAGIWKHLDYDKRYTALARRLRALLAKPENRAPQVERVVEDVLFRWRDFPTRKRHVSRTLRGIMTGNRGSSLSLLRNLLSQNEGNAFKAIQEQRIDPVALCKGLQDIKVPYRDANVVSDLLDEAEEIAREMSGVDEPRITSLHLLITMVEYRGDLDITHFFKKLGVCPVKLREFAEKSEREP